MPVLQFKGKTAVENHHYVVPHHTLEFDPKLSVLGKGEKPSLDGNLIIEGDNLLALKALLPTHAGRIKCIYIDPPYNTGDEGWVYNDKLNQPQFKEWIGQTVGKEGEDATRHDKWCCMMYPRLQLLRELLRDDGVIFISIDDNEIASLCFLLDEIFGAENRIERLIWKKSYGGGAKERHIVTLHEYVLCYAKDINRIEALELSPDPDAVERYYKYQDSKSDVRGPYRLKPLEATKSMGERKNLVYPILLPEGGEVWPQRQWWWSQERTLKALENDEIVFTQTKQGVSVSYKQYLKDEHGEERGAKLFSIIDGIYTQEGTSDLREVFDGKLALQFPKPVRLIKKLLELVTEGDDIILDSFAGSATTGHAVLSLNQEDGGDRKFVLVQMPFDTKENEKDGFNICQKITAERVRRVIKGYSYKTNGGKQQKVEGLGGSFSYVRLGEPLFNEYRDLGDRLPTYEEVAKYVFYTETSRDFDPQAINRETGKIGEHNGASYYLLYTPNETDDQACDLTWLKQVGAADKNRKLVVYCEKIWLHQDDLLKYEFEHGKEVRPMLVPFHLK
ncbi:MAG: site-specific DNA-methyltransferase [Acidobacteria bacterium]|nr:site-specific DNA-methyltransferase [Acidobacteriota bacterium]